MMPSPCTSMRPEKGMVRGHRADGLDLLQDALSHRGSVAPGGRAHKPSALIGQVEGQAVEFVFQRIKLAGDAPAFSAALPIPAAPALVLALSRL